MLSSEKVESFTILSYWDFTKHWSQRQKVGVKYSRFGVNKNPVTSLDLESLLLKTRHIWKVYSEEFYIWRLRDWFICMVNFFICFQCTTMMSGTSDTFASVHPPEKLGITKVVYARRELAHTVWRCDTVTVITRMVVTGLSLSTFPLSCCYYPSRPLLD